jgi:hypothetical protein
MIGATENGDDGGNLIRVIPAKGQDGFEEVGY